MFERRHDLFRVRGSNTRHQSAFGQIARDQRVVARFEFLESVLRDIETQPGFAFISVRSMTGVTMLGKDGPDVPVEVHLRRAGWRCGKRTRRDGTGQQPGQQPPPARLDVMQRAIHTLRGLIGRNHKRKKPIRTILKMAGRIGKPGVA